MKDRKNRHGQKDESAEEQAKLYKEKKNHPLASTILFVIHRVLLVGVAGMISTGIDNGGIDMSVGAIN